MRLDDINFKIVNHFIKGVKLQKIGFTEFNFEHIDSSNIIDEQDILNYFFKSNEFCYDSQPYFMRNHPKDPFYLKRPLNIEYLSSKSVSKKNNIDIIKFLEDFSSVEDIECFEDLIDRKFMCL